MSSKKLSTRRRCYAEQGNSRLLWRAKARLDRLDLYPAPVDLDGVRLVVAPWLFRVPGFRRFRGYATRHLVVLRGPQVDEELVVHELCHVWQLQHRAPRVWLSYVRPSTFTRDRTRYRANRYEREARYAVEATRRLPGSAAAPRGEHVPDRRDQGLRGG